MLLQDIYDDIDLSLKNIKGYINDIKVLLASAVITFPSPGWVEDSGPVINLKTLFPEYGNLVDLISESLTELIHLATVVEVNSLTFLSEGNIDGIESVRKPVKDLEDRLFDLSGGFRILTNQAFEDIEAGYITPEEIKNKVGLGIANSYEYLRESFSDANEILKSTIEGGGEIAEDYIKRVGVTAAKVAASVGKASAQVSTGFGRGFIEGLPPWMIVGGIFALYIIWTDPDLKKSITKSVTGVLG